MIPIILVIFCCSLIQSVFGIGLLFFGTPILLLMGYPFESVLLYLLPSSISINLLQVMTGWDDVVRFKTMAPIYCLPFLIVGLVLALYFGASYNMKPYVGAVMLLTGLTRLSPSTMASFHRAVKRFEKSGLAFLGLVHGTTNMGGAFLTMIVSARYLNKAAIRANIAFVYLLMAASQLVMLIVLKGLKGASLGAESLYLPAISLLTYALLGNRAFRASSQLVYQHLMTAFIVLIGINLILFT